MKLAPQSLALLKKHKLEQTRLRLLNGDRWVNSGYVFTKDNGQCLLLHQSSNVKLNPARMKSPCGINPIVRDLENHVAAVRRVALSRTLLCSPGLGAGASTSRKHTDGNRVFRVCGYKCIACTVAFVYTQALLAPLQNNSPNNSANFQKRSTN